MWAILDLMIVESGWDSFSHTEFNSDDFISFSNFVDDFLRLFYREKWPFYTKKSEKIATKVSGFYAKNVISIKNVSKSAQKAVKIV